MASSYALQFIESTDEKHKVFAQIYKAKTESMKEAYKTVVSIL